jgi:hypothetical protein
MLLLVGAPSLFHLHTLHTFLTLLQVVPPRQDKVPLTMCSMKYGLKNALNQERDGLFYAMHQKQKEMMEQMQYMQAQQTQIP